MPLSKKIEPPCRKMGRFALMAIEKHNQRGWLSCVREIGFCILRASTPRTYSPFEVGAHITEIGLLASPAQVSTHSNMWELLTWLHFGRWP